MDNYNYIKSLSRDEFAEWLENNCTNDESPWVLWWDKKYCQECPSLTEYVPELNKVCECTYCEIHHNCKYFQENEEVPSMIEICKMWLEEKYDV